MGSDLRFFISPVCGWGAAHAGEKGVRSPSLALQAARISAAAATFGCIRFSVPTWPKRKRRLKSARQCGFQRRQPLACFLDTSCHETRSIIRSDRERVVCQDDSVSVKKQADRKNSHLTNVNIPPSPTHTILDTTNLRHAGRYGVSERRAPTPVALH